MPKKQRTPSYRLHKRSGQAVVTINGTAHYLGKYNSEASHAAYDRLIAELERDPERALAFCQT